MKKEIKIKERSISYDLRISKRAKNLSMTAYHDKGLVVTVPFWAGEALAERFILKKSDWILKTFERFDALKDKVVLKNDRKTYLRYKEKARELILKSLERKNKIYNFEFNRVFVRNQKRVWGSCSPKKNLNFNFKLVFLPEHLLDYVVVHELCHLKEMNHSRRFWGLVKIAVPKYKEYKKELKSYI